MASCSMGVGFAPPTPTPAAPPLPPQQPPITMAALARVIAEAKAAAPHLLAYPLLVRQLNAFLLAPTTNVAQVAELANLLLVTLAVQNPSMAIATWQRAAAASTTLPLLPTAPQGLTIPLATATLASAAPAVAAATQPSPASVFPEPTYNATGVPTFDWESPPQP